MLIHMGNEPEKVRRVSAPALVAAEYQYTSKYIMPRRLLLSMPEIVLAVDHICKRGGSL